MSDDALTEAEAAVSERVRYLCMEIYQLCMRETPAVAITSLTMCVIEALKQGSETPYESGIGVVDVLVKVITEEFGPVDPDAPYPEAQEAGPVGPETD